MKIRYTLMVMLGSFIVFTISPSGSILETGVAIILLFSMIILAIQTIVALVKKVKSKTLPEVNPGAKEKPAEFKRNAFEKAVLGPEGSKCHVTLSCAYDFDRYKQGQRFSLTLFDDFLEMKNGKNAVIKLDLSQITNVKYGFERITTHVNKGMVTRATTGAVFGGGIGLLAGAISTETNNGKKKKIQHKRLLSIYYTSSVDNTQRCIVFEDFFGYGKALYDALLKTGAFEETNYRNI